MAINNTSKLKFPTVFRVFLIEKFLLRKNKLKSIKLLLFYNKFAQKQVNLYENIWLTEDDLATVGWCINLKWDCLARLRKLNFKGSDGTFYINVISNFVDRTNLPWDHFLTVRLVLVSTTWSYFQPFECIVRIVFGDQEKVVKDRLTSSNRRKLVVLAIEWVQFIKNRRQFRGDSGIFSLRSLHNTCSLFCHSANSIAFFFCLKVSSISMVSIARKNPPISLTE